LNGYKGKFIYDNRFTPELLQKAYYKLGDKNPSKVAKIVNEFSNSVLQIQQLRKLINTSKLLEWEDILEVLKNEEIIMLLLQNKVQTRLLLDDLESLHNISCNKK